MKPVVLKLLKFGVFAVVSILFLSLLSFSSGWSLNFDSHSEKKIGEYQQGQLLIDKEIELDAEKIFGENMTQLLSESVLNYLMVTHPEGPKSLATSTLTQTDYLKMRVIGGMLLTNRANQELRLYQESELTIVPDSQPTTDNYLRSLKAIIEEHLAQFDGEDLATLSYQAEGQDNLEARKKLIDFINQSQLALDKFVRVPVPQSWKDYHLGLLNLYSEAQYMAWGFLLARDDPYRAKFLYGNYQNFGYRFHAFKKDFETKVAEYLKTRK